MKKLFLLCLILTFSLIYSDSTETTSKDIMVDKSELKSIIENILKNIEKERIAEFKKMMDSKDVPTKE